MKLSRNDTVGAIGIAGAVGINFLSGTTDAFLDTAASVTSGNVNMNAQRTGNVTSIAPLASSFSMAACSRRMRCISSAA